MPYGIARSFSAFRERLAGPPARRAAYYALAHASFNCLAGSFEMPMAIRLAGGINRIALVYFFYYSTLMLGFVLGLLLVREGRASFVFRLDLGILTALCFGAALVLPWLRGIGSLAAYFLARGLAEGLYWAARHRAMLWSVRDSGRDRFALRLQSLVVALSVVLPLIGGAAITGLGRRTERPLLFAAASAGVATNQLPLGYAAMFLLTGAFLFLALTLSPNFRIGRSPVSFRSAFSLGSFAEARAWRIYIALTAATGVFVSVGAGVLNFGILKTEFRIGAFSASVALLSGLGFLLLGRFVAGRPRARVGGVLLGASAEFVSRLSYALFPWPGTLAVKAILDSAAAPLKSVFGENVNFSYVERISRRSGASVAEVYLYREAIIWAARALGCLAAGGVVMLAVASPVRWNLAAADASRIAARAFLAAAAFSPLIEWAFIRAFAKANASP